MLVELSYQVGEQLIGDKYETYNTYTHVITPSRTVWGSSYKADPWDDLCGIIHILVNEHIDSAGDFSSLTQLLSIHE